jgi:hypothetical protein
MGDPYADFAQPVAAAAPPGADPYAGIAEPAHPSELPIEQRNAMLQEKVRQPGVTATEVLNYAGTLGLTIKSHLNENLGHSDARVRDVTPKPPPPPPPDTSLGHNLAVVGNAVLHGGADFLNMVDSVINPGSHLAPSLLGGPEMSGGAQVEALADSVPFGHPETSGQHYLHAGVRGVTAALPFGGGGAPIRAVTAATSGAGAGLSGEAARQAGFGRGVQTIASLVGGLVGGLGARPLDRTVPSAPTEMPTAPPPIPRGPMATIARLTGTDKTVGARLVAQRLHDDGFNPYDAGRVITEAQANGTPAVLADLGENVRALGSSVSRQPGPARTIAKGFTKERQMGQMDRVRDAINRDLGPTTDVLAESARLIDEAKTNAAPVYTDALAGGSVAPLEQQFASAFRVSSGEVTSARRAVAAAQRRSTQAAAEISRAGNNVYGASGGLRAQRGAADELQAAQSRLTAAEAAHQSNLGRLRQAQADGSANAPGAIWSPRIQQFLDDPVTKTGLAKGLEVQRLEALAEGKPFNATEYAITGTDEAGNPIVSSVPNMRTLDAVKRGFDEILNNYPRGPSGKLILDQRGRAIDLSRKAFLREVDRINPTYADARAQYAGPAQLKDAMMDGKAALNKSASEINQRIKNMTPAEAEQYGLGLRSAIADAMERSPDGANKVRALIGNPQRRAVLQRVFGGKANLNRFVATMEDEQAAFETHQAVHGNSATQARAAEDQANSDFNLVRGVGSDLAAVGGGHVGIGLRAIERGADLLRFGAGKAGQSAREAASSLLFSTSPSEFRNALGEITLQSRRHLYRRQGLFPITGGAVAANQYGKQEP